MLLVWPEELKESDENISLSAVTREWSDRELACVLLMTANETNSLVDKIGEFWVAQIDIVQNQNAKKFFSRKPLPHLKAGKRRNSAWRPKNPETVQNSSLRHQERDSNSVSAMACEW